MVRSILLVISLFILRTAFGNVIPNSKLNEIDEESKPQEIQSLQDGDSELIRDKRFANKYGYYSDEYYPSNSWSGSYPSNYYSSNAYPSRYYSTTTVAKENPIARNDGHDSNLYYQPLFKYRETRTRRKKKLFVPNLWG